MLFTFDEMVAYKSWILLIHEEVDASAKAKHEVSDPLGFLGCRPPSEMCAQACEVFSFGAKRQS